MWVDIKLNYINQKKEKKVKLFTLQSFHSGESTLGVSKLHKTQNDSLVSTLQDVWSLKN